MADDRTIRVRLMAEIQSYVQGMRTAAGTTAEFGKEITGMSATTGANLEKIGRSSLLMAAGLATGLGLSVKAAVDWESAWAGVTKTVDGSASQMSALEDGLRRMAGELPASHAEIAGVAEAAGQLGVKVGDVESFTRVMIDLGETTNLTADQAATSLARIVNIMGTAGRDVSRMGSTIVELGNNSATTEAEIVELATRLAAAGKIAGLTEADVFAFASTLTSVGVEAEAGGTALSKVFTKVRDSVLDGGDSLETFAEVAGVSVESFSQAFREDASGAIALFIDGLGRMNDQGQSTTAVFEDLELTDQRLMRALLSTASAGDLLTDQLAMATRAWEENTALQTEAEKRYGTTAAQIGILRNKITDLAIDAGSTLLPALNGVVGALGNMADGFAALPDPAKNLGVALGTISTLGLGVVGTMATMAPKVAAAKEALEGMGTGAQFVGRNMGRIATGFAGVTAAVGAGVLIYEAATRASREYDDSVSEMVGSLQSVREGQLSVNEALDDFLAAQQLDLGSDQLDALNAFGIGVDDLRGAILAGQDVLDPFREKLRQMGFELKGVDFGRLDDAGGSEALAQLAGELGVSAGALRGLIDDIEDWDNVQQDAAETTIKQMLASEELTQAQVDQAAETLGLADAGENWVAVLDALAPKTEDAEDSASGLTDEMSRQEETAEELEDAIDALSEAIDSMIGVHISAEEALLDLRSGFDELTEKLRENGATLDETTEKGRENRQAIVDQVDSIFGLIEALRNQGAATDEASAAIEGHVGHLRHVMRQAGFSEEAIDAYLTKLGLTPETIATTIELYGDADVAARLDHITRNRTIHFTATGDFSHVKVPGGGRFESTGGPIYAAAGQLIAMQPRGTDTVPAMLTPGEFVHQKSAVDKYGVGFMEAVNNGTLSAPSAGGGTVIHRTYNISAQSLDPQAGALAVRDAIRTIENEGL